jgi:TonB family protein
MDEVSGFSVVLLMAPGKPNTPVTGLTPDEMRALKDADQLLPFKTFQKLDSVFVRGGNGGTVRLQGPDGREYSCLLSAYSSFRDPDKPLIVKIDVTDGNKVGSVLKSDFRIGLGETVIVGTSRVKGTDQALVVLLTAVPAVRIYKPGEAGVTNPTVISDVKPQYTPDALKARIEGTVTVECVVRPDGSVSDIRVVKSLDPDLDQQAIKAARQWRFAPGMKDGKPVPVRVTLEMTFTRR